MLRYDLLTVYGERLDRANVLPEYPRPQLQRDSYLNLNGEWRFAFSHTDAATETPDGAITVPFPPESALSGVRRTPRKGEELLYAREVVVPPGFLRDVTLLHLDAVDQACEVRWNGTALGKRAGGYLPVTYDVSGTVREGANELVVRVRDDLDCTHPTGKQRRKRGGIWYTTFSGIWQTVWLESVPEGYIRGLRVTPDLAGGGVALEIDSGADTFDVAVIAEGRRVAEARACGRHVALTVPASALRPWSPEDPFLYGLTVSAAGDTVTSYFALRSFTTDGRRFLLNGKPYFVNGLLDQGYFSDGIVTPASYDAYRDDILTAKSLGFNALRKHIKVEPMRFYHLCDTLGMLVLQDMVNVGRYSFFKDTILPFAGLRRRVPYRNANAAQRAAFTEHALATVSYLYNCPCVVYYTIFNEGWGQFDGDGLYDLLRDTDPTRVYDATSGWFRESRSDVASEHIYFRPIRLRAEARAVIVSEFGGYSCALPEHRFNTEKVFGYRKYDDLAAFGDAFCALYEDEVLPNVANGLAGAVYTQLSDVEDETNGVVTYDRRLRKLDPARVRPLMARLLEAANRSE